jgi:hypothetical protein
MSNELDRDIDHGTQPGVAPVPAAAESGRDIDRETQQLLRRMSETVAAERDRLKTLIQTAEFPLNGWDQIEGRFNKPFFNMSGKVDELTGILEMASAKNLNEAWKALEVVRGQLLAPLANDLLAAIGGLYLREKYLDDAGSSLPGRDGKSPISFSKLAEALRTDLTRRTGASGYPPVMIVGEERLDVSGAVIRLRFPACDIWSLPLTAHEYGYLWSRTAELPAFDDFRKELQSGVKGLSPAQEKRLCRVFADAFATLFGGPAYPFALLHLRFYPNEMPSSEMPAVTHRLLSVLHILQLMDEKPLAERYRIYFTKVRELLEEQKNIAFNAANVSQEGANLTEECVGWLDKIYDCFKNALFSSSIADTYNSWREAEGSQAGTITDVLKKGTKAKPLLSKRPSIWAVLNAAWHLRVNPPDRDPVSAEIISCHALSLLDDGDNSLIQAEGGGQRERLALLSGGKQS